ncbi:hypothetical protein Q73_16115 [Bacillus coahuilensis m2-6]|uniref:nucleoside triphosphate pyrophosphohydrolase n=1 Tax=Bacillus coahuilensis TaxID=408580 RepID=UPI000750365A|nr:nucleoside triphosphate pyrophosphohydrolase [Bacillus coahuilensis]KUP04250.1 hypothetical protein Q73_16115 [Bacillus coahuilensis m2-6]
MNKIDVIGLGSGDLDQLPYGIYKRLKESSHAYLRTKEHPVVRELEKEGFEYESFDAVYEEHDQFEAVYEAIVQTLIKKSEKGPVLYVVPGHPLVAERTVQLLIEAERNGEIELGILGGQSFLDSLFTSVKVDPIEGFQLVDGTNLHPSSILPTQNIFVGQVYDAMVASEVKLVLLEKYPYDHKVKLVTAAGSRDEVIREVPLYEMDHHAELNNLTSLFVPALTKKEELYKEFATLKEIISTLRGPNGCPWDRKQTHESLKKYLLEESYELIEAIDQDDIDGIIEELGDVLLQVMLHAQIGADDGMFDITDVIEVISEKMVRRHPHVFGDVSVKDADEVTSNWDEIKKQEKSSNVSSILDGKKGLPPLQQGYEFQKEAAKVGFDWEDPKDAWEKVKEELAEFAQEWEHGNNEDLQKEWGDVVFSLVNVARMLNIHPEEALVQTNLKFKHRFQYIEQAVAGRGQTLTDLSLEQLDALWNEAKGRE